MKRKPFMRLATENDIEDLKSMLLADDINDYIPEVLDKWVAEKGTYVATDGEEILGMAHKQTVPDGSLWLGGLRVRHTARRQGVGRIIAEFMVTQPESSVYRLVIDRDNEASIGLTLKTGYTERLAVSLWASENEAHDLELTDVPPESLRLSARDYFGTGELVPTAWYGFELNQRALRVLDDFDLKFVADRHRNLFLMNSEQSSLTPLILRKRERLADVPDGYILFGRRDDDFAGLGFAQTLWAKQLVFFEYERSAPGY